jgi:hypothetical protein
MNRPSLIQRGTGIEIPVVERRPGSFRFEQRQLLPDAGDFSRISVAAVL